MLLYNALSFFIPLAVAGRAAATQSASSLSTIYPSLRARADSLATLHHLMPRANSTSTNTTGPDYPYASDGRAKVPDKCKAYAIHYRLMLDSTMLIQTVDRQCKAFEAATATCDVSKQEKCACKASTFDAYGQ